MNMQALSAACLAALITASSGLGDWDYDNNHKGPAKWPGMFPTCDGERQSPIELGPEQSLQQPEMRGFIFNQTKKADSVTLTLINDGHKIELSWSPETNFSMGISADKLMYTAAALHWHWGANSHIGSEHTVDKKPYAAEGHLVFYNSLENRSFADVANTPYGLAVLGVFYETSSQDNPLFRFLESALADPALVNAPGKVVFSVPSDDFNLFNLSLPSERSEFYRYDGSLTTPPCSESVLWTVFRQPVPVSERQLNLLRVLKFADNATAMVNNFRPPQPLNPGKRPGTPRTVYRTFSSAAATLAGLPLAVMATVAMLARLVTAQSA